MLKNFNFVIFFILSTISISSWATCGDYQAVAKVEMTAGQIALLINPSSKSEIYLRVEFPEQSKLSPYINRFISSTISISQEMDFTRGVVSKIENIAEAIPDHLATSKGTKLKLIKKFKCKNKN